MLWWPGTFSRKRNPLPNAKLDIHVQTADDKFYASSFQILHYLFLSFFSRRCLLGAIILVVLLLWMIAQVSMFVSFFIIYMTCIILLYYSSTCCIFSFLTIFLNQLY